MGLEPGENSSTEYEQILHILSKQQRQGMMIAMDTLDTFRARLKALRRAMKYSQQDLADQLQFKRSTISNWELGRTKPDPDALSCLAEFFHVTTDYLLGCGSAPDTTVETFPPTDAASLDAFVRKVSDIIEFAEICRVHISDPSIVSEMDEQLVEVITQIKTVLAALPATSDNALPIEWRKLSALPQPAIPPILPVGPVIQVPVVNTLHADSTSLTGERVEGYEAVNAETYHRYGPDLFYYRVQNDDMQLEHIPCGCLVLIRKQDSVDLNDVALVKMHSGETTLRRVMCLENQVILYSSRTEIPPQQFPRSGVSIQGKVIEVKIEK